MRETILALAVLLLLPATALAEELLIVQGRSVTVKVPFRFERGANSNPEVVQAVPDVQTLRVILFGRKPGRATYTIWSGKRRIEYEIQVVPEDLAQLREDLAAQVESIEGVDVVIQGDRVLLEGEVALESDLQRIERFAQDANGQPRRNVVNLVRLSPLALKALARTIEQRIAGDESAPAERDGYAIGGIALADEIETLRQERLFEALQLPKELHERVRQTVVSFSNERKSALLTRISARARMSEPDADAERLADRIADAERAYQDADRGEIAAMKRHLDGSQMTRYLELLREFERTRLDLIER